jgi:hypothetical protein
MGKPPLVQRLAATFFQRPVVCQRFKMRCFRTALQDSLKRMPALTDVQYIRNGKMIVLPEMLRHIIGRNRCGKHAFLQGDPIRYYLQQGGFPGAVITHKTYPFAFVDSKVYIAE